MPLLWRDRQRAPESDADQCRRAWRLSHRQYLSNQRLERVFAERDAEIAARLGEGDMSEYRFQCRFCGSRFSLAQQLEAHEAACATPEERAALAAEGEEVETMTEATAPVKLLHCRRCHEGFPSLKELSAHARTVHAAEYTAQASASLKRYHQDRQKVDAAISGQAANAPDAHPEPAALPAGAGMRPAEHRPQPSAAACCPTCGGAVPAGTAQLVAEFTRAGIPEAQAFTLVRTARQVLLPGAAA